MVHTDGFSKDHEDFSWGIMTPLHRVVELEGVAVHKILKALQRLFDNNAAPNVQ